MQGHLRVAESKLQLHLSQASIGYVGEFGSECQSSHEEPHAPPPRLPVGRTGRPPEEDR